jgi:non-heme chloroperoxidase
MPYIEIEPGVRLFVQDWGAGEPVMFIHGWPLSSRIFEYHMLQLADHGFRAIGIDLRGFGYSDKPWHGNDYDTWANDIGVVMRILDLQDVLLVGYSMGGGICAHFAGAHRDHRLKRLALLAAAAPMAAPTAEMRRMYDGFITATLTDAASMGHQFLAMTASTDPFSASYMAWQIELAMLASLHASVSGLRELRDRDLSADLARIQVPTLICHGIYDEIIPYAFGEEQQRLIPLAHIEPFELSDHSLYHKEKQKLVDTLAHFARGEELHAKAA